MHHTCTGGPLGDAPGAVVAGYGDGAIRLYDPREGGEQAASLYPSHH